MAGEGIVKTPKTHSKMRATKRFEDLNADYHLPMKKMACRLSSGSRRAGTLGMMFGWKLHSSRKPGNPNWCQWLSCQTFASLRV
jgi:hypothetical protein